MKRNYRFCKHVIFLLGILSSSTINAESYPIRLGDVKPKGWLLKQLENEFTIGYGNIFPTIQPSLSHNVYGKEKVKNFSISNERDWMVRNETWWWGEHEGYYADALIRNAFLTDSVEQQLKAKDIIENVLKHQEADGYIGIYEKENRLDDLKDDNGELWSQSRILNALLAYYEFTGDKRVLDAVERAVKHTMSHYGEDKSYFLYHKYINGGGITHGLMFAETLEWLFRLTKDKEYLRFGQWLYADYSMADNIRDRDNQLKNLLNRQLLFDQHGVHVAEHARVVMWLGQYDKTGKFQRALDNQRHKFEIQSTPTGVLVCDELVKRRFGSPDLHYEYCVITEMLISGYYAAINYGDATISDWIENLAYNAAMGARTPDLTAITYCSQDNRDVCKMHGNNNRMQYSANHRNAACCNLNALKTFPYFVSNMWCVSNDTLTLLTYGPSELNTEINNHRINIVQETCYPFEHKVKLRISSEEKKELPIKVRKPEWADLVTIKGDNIIAEEIEGYWVLRKKWTNDDIVSLEFQTKPKMKRTYANEAYFQYGPLLYALPFKGEWVEKQKFEGGYATYDVYPADKKSQEEVLSGYSVKGNGNPIMIDKIDETSDVSWKDPVKLMKVNFLYNGELIQDTLQPIGTTSLRKLSFPLK